MSENEADPLIVSEDDLQSLRASAAATLEHLARIGVTHVPRADSSLPFTLAAPSAPAPSTPAGDAAPPPARNPANPPPAPLVSAPPTPAAPATPSAPPAPTATTEPYGAALPVADRESALSGIASEVASCTRCPELARLRRNTVPGEGNPAARVCFFGEAPGADEDRTGRPFVGRAGQLLTKIIEATTFQREEVFILNTLKCRPPGNRNPLPNEVANCCGYFERQFDVIQPEYIVCLGLVAAKALLPDAVAIGRMRGRFHSYRGSRVLVTYHPSYLLRNPQAKKAVWEDIQMLMRELGISVQRGR